MKQLIEIIKMAVISIPLRLKDRVTQGFHEIKFLHVQV